MSQHAAEGSGGLVHAPPATASETRMVAAGAAPPGRGPGPVGLDQLLALQRSVGNRATVGLVGAGAGVVQRAGPGDLTGYTLGVKAFGKTSAHKKMTATDAPKTCYEAAVYSLVVTGEISQPTFLGWAMTIPKADTYDVVDPEHDARVTDPAKLPKNHIIGFYRRFRPKEGKLEREVKNGQDWKLYHMVRTTAKPGSMVMGSNNGDRDGTTPTWSLNDVTKMFDWGGTELVSMHIGDDLPAAGTGGDGERDKLQFVAFAAPVPTVAQRLATKYPPA